MYYLIVLLNRINYLFRKTKSHRDREAVAYDDIQMEHSRLENEYTGRYGPHNNSFVWESAPSVGGSGMIYNKGWNDRVANDHELGSDVSKQDYQNKT